MRAVATVGDAACAAEDIFGVDACEAHADEQTACPKCGSVSKNLSAKRVGEGVQTERECYSCEHRFVVLL